MACVVIRFYHLKNMIIARGVTTQVTVLRNEVSVFRSFNIQFLGISADDPFLLSFSLNSEAVSELELLELLCSLISGGVW